MNSLIVYGSHDPYALIESGAAPKEKKGDPAKETEDHVFHKILSYLLDPDLQSTVSVSKPWKKATIKSVISNKTSKLNCLSKFLKGNFGNTLYPANELAISKFKKEMTQAKDLKKIKSTDEALKKKVAEALNELSDTEVRTILDLHKSTEILPPKKRARRNTNDAAVSAKSKPAADKAVALKELAHDLSVLGLVDIAHVLSWTIKMNAQKSAALLLVAKELADEGRYEEAMEAINEIPMNTDKAEALLHLTRALVQHHHLKEASTIADHIPLHKEKQQALALILAANKVS